LKNSTLIVLAKNPQMGKVKTRIARRVGDVSALDIYQQLLGKTQQLCAGLPNLEIAIYYSDFIDPLDGWVMPVNRHIQEQNSDLGVRMLSALTCELVRNPKVIIIGSDCPYITPDHVRSTIGMLNQYDAVIGPSVDGGFYLLGLSEIDATIFRDIRWSTDQVVNQLKINLVNHHRTMAELETLTDIDEYEDWLVYLS
jgi:rSAM/selenodomain-associated transferase 1